MNVRRFFSKYRKMAGAGILLLLVLFLCACGKDFPEKKEYDYEPSRIDPAEIMTPEDLSLTLKEADTERGIFSLQNTGEETYSCGSDTWVIELWEEDQWLTLTHPEKDSLLTEEYIAPGGTKELETYWFLPLTKSGTYRLLLPVSKDLGDIFYLSAEFEIN